MADDDKVKNEDLIQVSKDRFLPTEIKDQDPKHEDYSLAKEFAKSAKGFNWKFYSILLIFLGIVIGGTIAITTYIDIQNQQAQFSFDIEDISNLQEQISSKDREEKKLNLAKSDLSQIIKELDQKVVEVNSEYSKKMEDLAAKGLSTADLNKEINNLKVAKDAQIIKINKEYEPKIAAQETKIAQAETEYNKKKEKLEADINKAEKIVNNYKKLQQMQINALNKKHSNEIYNLKMKYNPFFTEDNVKQILKSSDKKKMLVKPSLEDISSLYNNKVVTESEINAIRKKIENYKVIIDRLQKIPYTNSVAPSLNVIQNDAYFLITEYERITKKLIKNLEVLQKYQRAFNQIAEFSVDSGIIIDATNKDDVIFSLKPVVTIEDGDTGMIFRDADQYIGSIVFQKYNGRANARVVDLTANAKIQPLDKIFVKKKKITPVETETIIEEETSNETPVETTDETLETDIEPTGTQIENSETGKEVAP
jgi:hypothetical protein